MTRLQSRTSMLADRDPAGAPPPHTATVPRSAAAEATTATTADPAASPPALELQKKLLEMIRRNEALRKAAPR